jgi:hypothetical protein
MCELEGRPEVSDATVGKQEARFWRHRECLTGSAILVVIGAAFAKPAVAGGAPPGGRRDPCSLLTVADAEKIAGTPMKPFTPLFSDKRTPTCIYEGVVTPATSATSSNVRPPRQ